MTLNYTLLLTLIFVNVDVLLQLPANKCRRLTKGSFGIAEVHFMNYPQTDRATTKIKNKDGTKGNFF